MWFSNETRIGDTSTPNNFVVSNNSPNVGQYGWTKSDNGYYNQLIQYVDECRQISEHVDEVASYIDSIMIEVQDIESIYLATKDIYDQTVLLKSDFDIKYYDFSSKYSDFSIKYEDFITKYNDFLIKYDQIVSYRDQALASAISSEASAVQSQNYYNLTYDLYLDLKEGQVYRGTWNPNTNAYPDAHGTNSVWDVILNTGQISYPFDGKTWRSGDRLVYVLSSLEYQQLAVGSGVLSVNGMVGSVTLSYQDVNAAPKGFGLGELEAYTVSDLDSNPTTWNSGGMGFFRGSASTLNKPNSQIGVGLLYRHQNTPLSPFYIEYFGNDNKCYSRSWSGTSWGVWKTIYDTTNKPTPSEIGTLTTSEIISALDFKYDKVGGVVNGPVTSTNDITSTSGNTNGSFLLTANSGGFPEIMGKASGQSGFDTTGSLRFYNDNTWRFGSNKIYHEGFKPTPADIGTLTTAQINTALGTKLNLSGGTMTGPITGALQKGSIVVNGQSSVSYQDSGQTVFHTLAFGNTFAIARNTNGDTNIWTITPGGQTQQNGPAYTKTGLVSQSVDGTKWISSESPDGMDPYIASRGVGEISNGVAIRFGNQITVEKSTVFNQLPISAYTGNRGFAGYGQASYSAREFSGSASVLRGALSYPFKITGSYALDCYLGSFAPTSNASDLRHVLGFSDGGSFNPTWRLGAGGQLEYTNASQAIGTISSTSPMTAPSFTPTSDIRIKSDLKEIENCLEVIKPFQPYNYIKEGVEGREDGLVAQSVMETMPDSVYKVEMTLEDVKKEVLTVNYNAITAVNSGAINELHELVMILSAKIDSLESEIVTLKANQS